MIAFVNENFVPESEAHISIGDRGFLYGDGIFETLRVYRGKPFRWHAHWKRLWRGAHFIGIELPLSEQEAQSIILNLLQQNHLQNAVIRFSVTRGVGRRGYSPSGCKRPTVVMTADHAPEIDAHSPPRRRLITSSFQVDRDDPLLEIKSCNRLTNVLARQEADEQGADDALLLNRHQEVTETTSANLFWIQDGAIGTPPIGSGLLPGVTRECVLELCHSLGYTVHEHPVDLPSLKKADALFLTLSSLEIVGVTQLDEVEFYPHEIVDELRHAFQGLIHRPH